MSHSSIDIWFCAVALGCAALACTHDVRTRRIPNWLTGPAALAALLAHFSLGGWVSMVSAAAAGLIAGTAMLAFFLAGGMGAGDVKLMVAVACFTGLHPLGTRLLAPCVPSSLPGITAHCGILSPAAFGWHNTITATGWFRTQSTMCAAAQACACRLRCPSPPGASARFCCNFPQVPDEQSPPHHHRKRRSVPVFRRGHTRF
jgi:hypothetical protein